MLELLAAGAAGFWVGGWLMVKITRRSLDRGVLGQLYREQINESFRTGFLTAADCVTLCGHEELAGHLRRAAAAVAAANDNNN